MRFNFSLEKVIGTVILTLVGILIIDALLKAAGYTNYTDTANIIIIALAILSFFYQPNP